MQKFYSDQEIKAILGDPDSEKQKAKNAYELLGLEKPKETMSAGEANAFQKQVEQAYLNKLALVLDTDKFSEDALQRLGYLYYKKVSVRSLPIQLFNAALLLHNPAIRKEYNGLLEAGMTLMQARQALSEKNNPTISEHDMQLIEDLWDSVKNRKTQQQAATEQNAPQPVSQLQLNLLDQSLMTLNQTIT